MDSGRTTRTHSSRFTRSRNLGLQRKGTRWKALTFPTDNPVKRIDYVIYKQGAGTHVKVYNAQLIGQKPWKGTETTDLKAGMMSKDSALFASDHRGVVVDFEFSWCVCLTILHFN